MGEFLAERGDRMRKMIAVYHFGAYITLLI